MHRLLASSCSASRLGQDGGRPGPAWPCGRSRKTVGAIRHHRNCQISVGRCHGAVYAERSQAVTVSPTVVIVAMLCLLVLGLAAIRRARPEDIPKIFSSWLRWFR